MSENAGEKIVGRTEKDDDLCVNELREKLRNKGIDVNIDEKVLVKYLRATLYKVDESFSLLFNYITNFKKYPKYFDNVCLAKNAVENGFYYYLPERNATGEMVTILEFSKWDERETSFSTAIAAMVYAIELLEMDERTQKFGTIQIVDMGNLRYSQFKRLGITEARSMIALTEKALPVRCRKTFICYENRMTNTLYAMAKPFLRREIKQTITFIGEDMSELHKMVTPTILPPRYGGTATKRDPIEFYKIIEKHQHDFDALWKPFK